MARGKEFDYCHSLRMLAKQFPQEPLQEAAKGASFPVGDEDVVQAASAGLTKNKDLFYMPSNR